MIDDVDVSASSLRLLASQTLKKWPLEAILNLLSDEDYVVRTLAARELHLYADKKIFDRVAELSASNIDFLREISAFVLGQLGTPTMPFKNDAIPVLLRLISDDEPEVRAAAAAAIGHAFFAGMPKEVENALYAAASDKNTEVRSCVAASLGSASPREETLKTLDRLLEDSDETVKEYAKLGKDILEGGDPEPVN